jgi:hypothetical protein
MQARGPTLPAVLRVMPGILHLAGTLSPSLKTRPHRAPCPPCVLARPRPSRPPAPLRSSAASFGSGRLHAKPSSPPPSPTPTLTLQPPLDPCIESPTAGTAAAAATAAGRRRPTSPALPLPTRAQESAPKDPRVDSRPRPAGCGRRFAGIWPDRCRPVPGDDIARFVIFLGSFVQSKGMVVNLQKLPGASAQNCNFNSVAELQKLVKFVQILGKFRKLQNQICWIRCEECYNFCYSHKFGFWMFLT